MSKVDSKLHMGVISNHESLTSLFKQRKVDKYMIDVFSSTDPEYLYVHCVALALIFISHLVMNLNF